jgi:hypothetical protein
MKNYILCAAIWFKDDVVHECQPTNIDTGIVVCGRRHHNCYITAWEIGDNKRIKDCHESNAKAIQGFLTSDDKFVDRKEAGKIAFEFGQINAPDDCLFSEDLY